MDKLIWDKVPGTPQTPQAMFCPNSQCKNFRDPPESANWCYRYGSYHTKCFGKVSRFRCRDCGKCFSTQTFSIDYYAKCRVDYSQILNSLVVGEGIVDPASLVDHRKETVQNRVDRLARAFLAAGADLRNGKPIDREFLQAGSARVFPR